MILRVAKWSKSSYEGSTTVESFMHPLECELGETLGLIWQLSMDMRMDVHTPPCVRIYCCPLSSSLTIDPFSQLFVHQRTEEEVPNLPFFFGWL
jgi:hypothetical protein